MEPINADTKKQLIKRLQYLWTWELADVFILPAMGVFFAYVSRSQPGIAILYGSLVVGLILV